MGKPRYTVTLETNATPEDKQAVLDGLSAFNRSQIGVDASDDMQPLNLFVRANDGTIMGGLLGVTYWNWLYISILWVHEDLRGKAFGTDLLRAAEREAVARGCHSVCLDTMSFQALPFYQKQGYSLYGQLNDFPIGHQRYYLQKKLIVEAESQ
ncbi:MAG: GNAT family N-acetyltransferase [Anaerolineae bacterium]|nr:GNAT family N-acetyltransferase [Anaerolineae bacterium]